MSIILVPTNISVSDTHKYGVSHNFWVSDTVSVVSDTANMDTANMLFANHHASPRRKTNPGLEVEISPLN